MIRSVDEEVLQDICRDTALDNYGFLYVNDHKDEIKAEYEGADTGLTSAGSISLSAIEETLQSIADDDLSVFDRLRSGVYYCDPFETREGSRVSDELKRIFTYDLVVNKQTIESRFDIAPTDVDFFAGELEDEDYVRRIAAGERDYYVSGPRLKDETSGDASVTSRLREEATSGTISHADLESVIDVAATSDVIRFLEREDFIVDLDEEYLVQDAVDDYCDALARQMAESVATEFEETGYAVPAAELDQILENRINDLSTVLRVAPELQSSLLDHTRDALEDQLALETEQTDDGTEMIAMQASEYADRGFDEFIDEHAQAVFDRVIEGDHPLTTASDYRDAGHPMIADLDLGQSAQTQSFLRSAVTDRFNELVDEEWAGSDSDTER